MIGVDRGDIRGAERRGEERRRWSGGVAVDMDRQRDGGRLETNFMERVNKSSFNQSIFF